MSQKLENIGFYTLSNHRASQTNETSPMWRCEMILTNRCNFKCPYCRGLSILSEDCTKDMSFDVAIQVLQQWTNDGLKNIRFSGGEPTLYKKLPQLVDYSKKHGVERIAISTNGSMPINIYKELINLGVNDFSISLDACCATFGNKMSGVSGYWDIVTSNIRELSKLTYVTTGIVLTEENVGETTKIIKFAHELGVSDIRIISAAQYNKILSGIENIDNDILDLHPILNYRVKNLSKGRNVRGINIKDCNKCHLVKDDSVVAGQWHFPCVIYMREGGKAIGKINSNMRKDRIEWFKTHNSYKDEICRNNCLDVCVDYNNKVDSFI
jgi:MoaA/NifB/PqqE/SkfB family radical SAM enzyme